MARLTEKQKRFVAEYLVDLNATAAAKRAGYSERTANEQGARLLANVSIQEALHSAIEQRSKRTEITQDRVLEELAAIGFSKATDYATVRGPIVEITPTDQLTEDQKKVVASIEQGNFGIKLKLHDKVKALELLGKHLGMFDRVASADSIPTNNLLEQIEASTKALEDEEDELREIQPETADQYELVEDEAISGS